MTFDSISTICSGQGGDHILMVILNIKNYVLSGMLSLQNKS